MSRILSVWEMGANMGHIDRMLVTARALRERGHAVRFLLRDLSRAHPRVAAQGFAMGQAPVWLPRLANAPRASNFAAVLAAAGWMDSAGLAGLLAGWRDAFALARPDLLICDHAPTAMLAARGLGFPVWAIGNSFELPPPGPFFPSMASDDAREAARCAAYDEALLVPTNKALALLGAAPLPRLSDLFAHAQRALASLPELAHYDGYPAGTVWAGPSYVGDVGAVPQWPAGDGPRVFVYLSPSHSGLRPLIDALKALGCIALVHAKGLSPDAAKQLGDARIRFEPAPVQVDPAVAAADLVVSHASMGTVTAACIAGKPQLVLPAQAEQGMVARRVVQLGIGLALPQRSDGPPPAGTPPLDALAPLKRVLHEPVFAATARVLAARHAGSSPQRTGERLAALVLGSIPTAGGDA